MVKIIGRKKITAIILAIFFIINMVSPITKAGSTSEIISGIKNFEDARKNYTVNGVHSEMEINSTELQNASNTIYNTLLIIGIVAAVIVGLVIAMKFMTGSVEQKAQVKETLIPYILGCFVIFGAFGIWRIILNILNQTVV